MDVEQFESRKREHIRHALDPAHQAHGLSGLDQIHLPHEALPELNLDEVRLESRRLGAMASVPYYIAGMTAGHADAASINRLLARACARRGWAMGVGSQRRQLEEPAAGLDEWQRIREEAPGLVLFANLGISQLISASASQVRALVESIGAAALGVHLNALQECLQVEGTPRFRGALESLRRVCSELTVPVILKETGCGFSAQTFEKLLGTGIAAVDVSGLGGTHWGRIEGARARGADPVRAGAAATFASWGQSTVASVIAAGQVFGARVDAPEIWASGGVRSGLDAAKLIALGASQVGYAKPALEAALEGERSLDQWMERQEFELRVALFCTGCSRPDELRQRGSRWKTAASVL